MRWDYHMRIAKKNTIMYPAADNAAIAMTSFDRANLRHILLGQE